MFRVLSLFSRGTYHKRIMHSLYFVRTTVFRVVINFLFATIVFCASVFLYGSFYYTYIPHLIHVRPVHLQYQSCGETAGLCSFPTATVALSKKPQLLMVGQPYRVLLDIEMPESPANQQLGMFMVCTELRDKQGEVLESSCRSAMLHYKSTLFHTISTFVLSPLIMMGSSEEKQGVTLELFSEYQENPARPTKEVFVEVQNRFIEIYSMTLHIHAHFTGLRYFMYHWPVLSAILGVSINLFFLSIIAFLSWYRFFTTQSDVVKVGNHGRILVSASHGTHAGSQKKGKKEADKLCKDKGKKIRLMEPQSAGQSRSEERSQGEMAATASILEERNKTDDFEILGNNGSSEIGTENTPVKTTDHIQELSSGDVTNEEHAGLRRRSGSVQQPAVAAELVS